MAVESEKTKSPWLTSYNLVAVAIPGAVFILIILGKAAELRACLKSWAEMSGIQVGSLGIFTIAAFCVRQVLQGLGAFGMAAVQFVNFGYEVKPVPIVSA